MPDPNLKAAAAEINAVLKKHDCAGVILLSSQSHLEYLYEIEPSWSCATVEKAPDGGITAFRFKSKLENYDSLEAQKKSAEDTLGMFHGLGVLATQASSAMASISRAVAQRYGFVGHILKDE